MKLLAALAALVALFGFSRSSTAPAPSSPAPKPGGTTPTAPKPGGAGAPPWNPPAPGPALKQSKITGEMTSWAVALMRSSAPMHSLHTRDFDPGGTVVGRVEWHTYQARTGKSFPGGIRAVSLYRPTGVA